MCAPQATVASQARGPALERPPQTESAGAQGAAALPSKLGLCCLGAGAITVRPGRSVTAVVRPGDGTLRGSALPGAAHRPPELRTRDSDLGPGFLPSCLRRSVWALAVRRSAPPSLALGVRSLLVVGPWVVPLYPPRPAAPSPASVRCGASRAHALVCGRPCGASQRRRTR